MGKYEIFSNRMNKLAKEAFQKYTQAEAKFEAAKRQYDHYPKRTGPMVTADYQAASARAEADFLEARKALMEAKAEMESKNSDVAALRKELASKLAEDYAATPDSVDANTVELLRTGILEADEFVRLMNTAKKGGNSTMARVIAKYAEKQAAAMLKDNDGEETQSIRDLRAVATLAPKSAGERELAMFDVMGECFKRTSANPAMIPDWDNLTHNSMENL